MHRQQPLNPTADIALHLLHLPGQLDRAVDVEAAGRGELAGEVEGVEEELEEVGELVPARLAELDGGEVDVGDYGEDGFDGVAELDGGLTAEADAAGYGDQFFQELGGDFAAGEEGVHWRGKGRFFCYSEEESVRVVFRMGR